MPDPLADKQQEKARSVLLYINVIKKIFPMKDEELITLSDLIDDQNINVAQVIRHFMGIFEKVFNKQVTKISHINHLEVNELQRELEPLIKYKNAVA